MSREITLAKHKRTMQHLTYGIEQPRDLLMKLEWDADKLNTSPHPYDGFNFVLTAAVLAEWIQKFYSSELAPEPFSAPSKEHKAWLLPISSSQWISDTSYLPNPHCDFRHHIANALAICTHTANASKHFHWQDRGDIGSIGEAPPISSYYQYFFTSTAQDVYLDFQGENYGLQQIKGILLQFYTGLIDYLDGLRIQSKS